MQGHVGGRVARSPAAAKGVSLVELLVAMVIGVTILGIVLTAFVGTQRVLNLLTARSDAQEAALLALDSIDREFRGSTAASLTIASFPPSFGISFEVQDAATMLNSLALPHFQPTNFFVVYYYDGQTFWRKTLSSTPPPQPAFGTVCRLSDDQLKFAMLNANHSERPLATGVISAEVDPPTYPTTEVTNGITLRLTVERPVSGTRQIVQQEALTSICPRN